MNKELQFIGKPVIRQDAYEKVTGKAKFGDDYYFPGMLHGVMVRTNASHAIIKNIDYSDSDLDDICICDSDDIIGNKKVGALTKDQPIFCYDKIRNPSDVVCMLVGDDDKKLRKLKDKVNVELEILPVLTNAEKALDKNAPLIHPDAGTNQIVHYPLRKGNIEEGFNNCDHIIEQKYTTPHVEHAYIEPEVVVAVPMEGKKGIKVLGSIQNPYTCRRVVAGVLDLPLTKVRIVQAEMGGSFGGKDDTVNVIAARAAVAALKFNKPVKIRYSREDSLNESYKRHPYFMNYKVGFNDDGKLVAMKIDIIADGGTYASLSPFVTWRTVVQATGPYEVPNVETNVRAVYTNNPYTGAFRGFGSPQPIFAQESVMDEIAEKVGKSPVEIRRINGFKSGSETASGQILGKHDVNLITVLEEAVKHSDFDTKLSIYSSTQVPDFQIDESNNSNFILEHSDFNDPKLMKRKGIGLATSFRGCALGAEGIDAAASYISVQQDGSVYLLSGLAENGQGLRTTFSLITAEIFGISPEHIQYLEMDTGIVPDSGPTVASRSTLMGGGATKNAAEIIKSRLEAFLVTHWNTMNKGELLFKNNEVIWSEDPSKRMGFAELCNSAYWKGVSLATIGWYEGPKVDWNEETGQGAAYFTYVYGCQVAEVEVDLSTGEVYIERIVAVHDPGKIINLLGAQGQVYGGVTQGAGFGLWEEVNSFDGKIKEDNFDQYLIPTSQDIGKIEAHFVEGKDIYGAWGAKSLGEPTLELTAAAIANAVKNATGLRFYNLPLNLEEILLNRKLKPTDLSRGSKK
jgi:CO/xanthine dehydrogenase Mo-binding subunit